jgi:hypothetical protein
VTPPKRRPDHGKRYKDPVELRAAVLAQCALEHDSVQHPGAREPGPLGVPASKLKTYFAARRGEDRPRTANVRAALVRLRTAADEVLGISDGGEYRTYILSIRRPLEQIAHMLPPHALPTDAQRVLGLYDFAIEGGMARPPEEKLVRLLAVTSLLASDDIDQPGAHGRTVSEVITKRSRAMREALRSWHGPLTYRD